MSQQTTGTVQHTVTAGPSRESCVHAMITYNQFRESNPAAKVTFTVNNHGTIGAYIVGMKSEGAANNWILEGYTIGTPGVNSRSFKMMFNTVRRSGSITFKEAEKSPSNDKSQTPVSKSIPAPIKVNGGYYAGRSYTVFELRNLFSPHPQLGNSAFTTLFMRSASGNVYQIFCKKGVWHILNKKNGHTKQLNDEDLQIPNIRTGDAFYFSGGNTAEVTEIIAVNAGPIRCDSPQGKFSDIADGLQIRYPQ